MGASADQLNHHITELFGDKETRWYQVAVHNGVVEALYEGHMRICVIQPTGTGKTLSSGLILVSNEVREFLGVTDRPLKCLFVSHRHRLLSQAEEVFAASANIEIIPQSMMSPIPEDVEFDLVINDECHHEATMSFQYQLDQLTNTPIIGLTATPDRTDRKLCKFSKFIEPMTRKQAVEQGYLAQTYIDTFVDSPARTHVDITADIIDQCYDQMGQTMVFVRTKKECRELKRILDQKGLTSRALIDISETELNNQLDQFEGNEYQFAISCNKLGEGIDIQNCKSVLIGRTVGSYPLLNQMIGRASRPDCACQIYEIVNPLSDNNLESTVITGTPQRHNLWYKVRGEWRIHTIIDREKDKNIELAA